MGRFQEAIAGALTGSTEVLLMQPSNFWKTELQQKRFNLSRALNPKYAYRGVTIAAMAIAPVVAIQFSMNGACLSALSALSSSTSTSTTTTTTKPPTATISILSGVIAGVSSALFQSPFQLIEINQQKHGGTIAAVVQKIARTHGTRALWRGLSMTATREGLFCCSYIAVSPLLGRALYERTSLNDSMSLLVGALLGGSMGAVLTHPADTLKTRLQGDLFAVEGSGREPVNIHVRAALKDMVVTWGRKPSNVMFGMYAGFTPRLFRLCCCTLIYGQLNPFYSSMLEA